jgi:hypothetical protein
LDKNTSTDSLVRSPAFLSVAAYHHCFTKTPGTTISLLFPLFLEAPRAL